MFSQHSDRRIAMLSVHTCPLAALGGKKTGGMNVYVRELSRELGARGFHVDVFTRSQNPCVPHITSGDIAPGVRVIHIPAGPEEPLSTRVLYPHLPQFAEGVLQFAEAQGISYDVIHSHYWLSGWVAERLREAWHVPFVQMFHTLGHMKNRVALNDEEREPPLRLQTETQLVKNADALVAATPAERIQLMWLYKASIEKIHVIPPGVDLNHFRPVEMMEARRAINVPLVDKMLLFVGRIEPLKGIDTLIRAIALLRQSTSAALCKKMYLVIIGGSPPGEVEDDEDLELRRLKALCAKLGLDDLVTFLGAKSQQTLPYYYSAAEAVIMPSHYESFGMVALEAMACGTPVVTSEVGGLAYLVQDGVTGFHVPTGDPEELASRIQLILERPELRQELSQSAIRHAQGYSWQHVADQVQKLYQRILQ